MRYSITVQVFGIIIYSLSLAPNMPVEINADPDRFHQVLVNLVGNAIKFTQHGGIEVKVYMRNKNRLAIDVTDSGPALLMNNCPIFLKLFGAAAIMLNVSNKVQG